MPRSRFIFTTDDEAAQWVASRIPHVGNDGFGPCSTALVLASDKVIAGVVYHDWQEKFGTIQLSMAADSPLWARRENIFHLLNYPFRNLNCYKVFTATPLDNNAAIDVNYHIGFKREAVLAHQFGKNRHGVISRLLLPEFVKLYEARFAKREPKISGL